MSEPSRSEPGGVSWIEQIRARLASPAPRRLPPGDGRKAAVLVPLYVDAGELWTVLTRRTENLPSHKNQYAFPGGGLELGEDFWEGALREAREEIGIEPKTVLRLGELDEARSIADYRIVPCVGAVPFPLKTEINEAEIAEVFSVPLSAFTNPRLVEERPVAIDGRERVLRIYHIGSRRVWGLTARVLQNLLVRLGVEPAGASVN